MIEIIKRGKPREIVYYGVCDKCGTKVKATGASVRSEQERPVVGCPIDHYCGCPVCNTRIWLRTGMPL